MINRLRAAAKLATAAASAPGLMARLSATLPWRLKAESYLAGFREIRPPRAGAGSPNSSALWEYFDNHVEGPGIWKWSHYFEIYERHFSKFVGTDVNVLEIGIYSGGSLGMWHAYFGQRCHVVGVDIEPACRCYEGERTSVFIGDQADRGFWRRFREAAPPIDILIDDGGHTPEQQRVTLEEMLPHLRPGGVYLCEDVHGVRNDFASYAAVLADSLNSMGDRSEFQKSVHSIHFYPYCVVIEKHASEPAALVAPKRGTSWQPFFDSPPSRRGHGA
jgi:hypothetical protein